MIRVAVSACLLGENCKYNGHNNYNLDVTKLKDRVEFIPICPETFGGLPTPRTPSEIKGSKVFYKTGENVTKNFKLGAQKALEIIEEKKIKVAILKDGSPSCGSTYIYDGTFTGATKPGVGLTAKILKEKGVKVYSEKELEKFIKEILEK